MPAPIRVATHTTGFAASSATGFCRPPRGGADRVGRASALDGAPA
jgi:hypothetical protein